MTNYQWQTTRFDIPEHFAFVAYYPGASMALDGKPWGAYVAGWGDYSWHATVDEAKDAVETHLAFVAAGVAR